MFNTYRLFRPNYKKLSLRYITLMAFVSVYP